MPSALAAGAAVESPTLILSLEVGERFVPWDSHGDEPNAHALGRVYRLLSKCSLNPGNVRSRLSTAFISAKPNAASRSWLMVWVALGPHPDANDVEDDRSVPPERFTSRTMRATSRPPPITIALATAFAMVWVWVLEPLMEDRR